MPRRPPGLQAQRSTVGAEVFIESSRARRTLPAVRILFLDVDGVLNRAAFQPEDTFELAGWIEPELAARLDAAVREVEAEIVMSSDWRIDRPLEELRAQLAHAGIGVGLRGMTPVLAGQPRWREIEAWMVEHHAHPEDIVIVDDAPTMGPLGRRHVQTSPHDGLDEAAVAAIRAMFSPG